MAARPLGMPLRRPARGDDPVSSYAWDVCSGKVIAGRLVRLACERHFRDLATGGARGLRYDPAWARYAVDFYPRYLRHSRGEWAGKPVQLEPWQEFGVGSVFGWFRKNGTRRFRTSYQEVARKNGKSPVAAGVGLYGLIVDGEPGADVYAVATSKAQARIVFGEAQRMVRASEELRSNVAVFRQNLSIDRTSSKFEPLASDEKTLDGLSPHFVLIDELHAHRSRALLDVLDTALGARRQPLVWIITTAGDTDPESAYAQENAYAIGVLENTAPDDSYFALIYTLDSTDRWDDPKVWQKANPNLGVSVYLDDLKRQALKAKQSPAAQTAFKRLRCNVRTADASRAIDMDVWRRNSRGRAIDPEDYRGRPCWCALDLSSKIDLSCFLRLYEPRQPGEPWVVIPRFWMPADSVAEKADRDRVQYSRWIDAHLIEVTPGDVIDHSEIQAAVLEDSRHSRFLGIAADPWNATQMMVDLGSKGQPVFEFVQGLRSYTAPTRELIAWLLAGKIDHGDHPVLAWMASNLAVTKPDKNLNIMPTKAHSTGRIDGMTCLIMAIGLHLTKAMTRSPYETHGPRVA